MKNVKLSLIALAVAAGSAQIAVAAQADSKGFVEDSSLTLTNRNYYFNHDKQNGRVDAREWAHAMLLDYKSGFTQGTVGFGVDAFAYGVLKLDEQGGSTGNLYIKNDGDRESFGQIGGAAKVRVSNTVARFGNLQPNAPVFAAGGSRIKPQTAQGFELTSKDLGDVALQAGHFTAGTGWRGNDNKDLILASYAGIAADSVDYLGGDYSVNDNLSFSLYGADFEDVWHQYYGNANYTLPLAAGQKLNFDANLYRTVDSGNALAGEIDNTAWSLAAAYSIGAHKFTLAYQAVDGDEAFDYAGFGAEDSVGDSINLANSIQYSDFNGPGEKSVQVRYDVKMAEYGVPGLSFMARYVRGTDIDGSHADATGAYAGLYGSDDRESETNVEAKYVVQSGAAKDLAVRVRQAWHRGDASTGGDQNQLRVMLSYPISIL